MSCPTATISTNLNLGFLCCNLHVAQFTNDGDNIFRRNNDHRDMITIAYSVDDSH